MNIRKIHIYGLNSHGISALKFGLKKGMEVSASDLNSNLNITENLKGAEIVLGSHPQELLDKADKIIYSPGVINNYEFYDLYCRNAKCISGADLAFLLNEWNYENIISVTGSYGKSTIISMIKFLLEKNNIKVYLPGNYETPFTDLGKLKNNEFILAEMDYQQLLISKYFRGANNIITNIICENHVFSDDLLYITSKLNFSKKMKKTDLCLTSKEVYKIAKENNFITQNLVVVEDVVNSKDDIIFDQNIKYLTILADRLGIRISNITKEMFMEQIPKGRFYEQKLTEKITFINDGISKGKYSLNRALKYLENKERAILVTYCDDITSEKVEIIKPNGLSKNELRMCLISIKHKNKNNDVKKYICFSPGTCSLGDFSSFNQRAEFFESELLKN